MPEISYRRFRAEVMDLYEPPAKAKATATKMRQVLDEVAGLRIRTTGQLRPPLVARWTKAQLDAGRSPNTVRGLLSYLRAACFYALDEGYLERVPFSRRRKYVRREPGAPRRHHPAAAIGKVLDDLAGRAPLSWEDARLHALFATYAFTGVRRNEALYLHAADFDRERGILWIDPRRRRLKTEAAAAPVACPDRLVETLAAWAPEVGSDWLFPRMDRGGPWVGGMPGRKPLDRIKAAGEACGVGGLTIQSLRHSWATHAESLWMLSGPLIQRNLRHAAESTSLRNYRHADLANLRAALRSIDFRPRPDRAA